jgi:hypothetical protein
MLVRTLVSDLRSLDVNFEDVLASRLVRIPFQDLQVIETTS